jgi:hypothetical protein
LACAKIPAVKGPRITLSCDCGAQEWVRYGESWTCPSCGRRYDTTRIPPDEYGELAALDRRYKIGNWIVVSVLAVGVLVVALTGAIISIFAGLAVALLGWFLYIKPLVHRSHKRAVAKLTRSWNLKAEPE